MIATIVPGRDVKLFPTAFSVIASPSVLMIRRVWSTGQHGRPPELRHPCKLPELRTTHLRQWRRGLSTQFQAQSNYDTWWWCCRACRCRLNCSCPLSSIDYSCSPDSRASFFLFVEITAIYERPSVPMEGRNHCPAPMEAMSAEAMHLDALLPLARP